MHLIGFRNFIDQKFSFSKSNINVINGKNGAGKTSILEGISLLSFGKGIRNAKFSDMKNIHEHENWHINYLVETFIGQAKIDNIQSQTQRIIYINDSKIKSSELSNYIKIAIFNPEQDYLFTKSNSHKTTFFDQLCYGFDAKYLTHMATYEYLKKERLDLLKLSFFDNKILDQIEYKLSEAMYFIIKIRNDFVDLISEILRNNYKIFLSLNGKLSDTYKKHSNEDFVIDEFQSYLKNARSIDLSAKKTTFSINLDEYKIFSEEFAMEASNCSTGEQKILLMKIFLTSILLIKNTNNISPIILLDEVLCHFDSKNQERLIDKIRSLNLQTFITISDREIPKILQQDYIVNI